MMLTGLFGDLPWFDWLNKAYEVWDLTSRRKEVLRRVEEAKIKLLEQGWASFGGKWEMLAQIPDGLDRFIRACRCQDDLPEKPDYPSLAKCFGGRENPPASQEEALSVDFEDLWEYKEHVAAVL